eukprot:403360717
MLINSQQPSQLLLQFKNTYLAYCAVNTSTYASSQLFLDPYQSILIALDDAYKNQQSTIMINLQNQGLNEQTLIPLIKTMQVYPGLVSGLDVSQNLYFKESCLKMLLQVLENETNLIYLNCDKTGITDSSAIPLVNLLPRTNLQILNLSSIQVTATGSENLINALIRLIKQKQLVKLRELDLSNNKIGDNFACQLFDAIVNYQFQNKNSQQKQAISKNCNFGRKGSLIGQQDQNSSFLVQNLIDEYRCPLEVLNLSRNNLGFKTGAHMMQLLVENQVKNTTKLQKIDLQYNTISLLVQNSIKKILSETQYSIQKAKSQNSQTNQSCSTTFHKSNNFSISKYGQSLSRENIQHSKSTIILNNITNDSQNETPQKINQQFGKVNESQRGGSKIMSSFNIYANKASVKSPMIRDRGIINSSTAKTHHFQELQQNLLNHQEQSDEHKDKMISPRDLVQTNYTNQKSKINHRSNYSEDNLTNLSIDDTTSKLEHKFLQSNSRSPSLIPKTERDSQNYPQNVNNRGLQTRKDNLQGSTLQQPEYDLSMTASANKINQLNKFQQYHQSNFQNILQKDNQEPQNNNIQSQHPFYRNINKQNAGRSNIDVSSQNSINNDFKPFIEIMRQRQNLKREENLLEQLERKNNSFELLKKNFAMGYSIDNSNYCSRQASPEKQQILLSTISAQKYLDQEQKEEHNLSSPGFVNTTNNSNIPHQNLQQNETSHFMSPSINPMLLDNDDSTLRTLPLESKDQTLIVQYQNHDLKDDYNNINTVTYVNTIKNNTQNMHDEMTEFNVFNENGELKTEFENNIKTSQNFNNIPNQNLQQQNYKNLINQKQQNYMENLPSITNIGIEDQEISYKKHQKSLESDQIKEMMKQEIIRLQEIYEQYTNQKQTVKHDESSFHNFSQDLQKSHYISNDENNHTLDNTATHQSSITPVAQFKQLTNKYIPANK